MRLGKDNTLPRSSLPSLHTKWWVGRSFVIHSPHSSLGICHEWMSLQCWTPRPTLSTATQLHKAISSCKRCIQHEGNCAKAPVGPIIVTAPLELLHVDFTQHWDHMIELDWPPNVVNLFWSFVTILQNTSWVYMWPLIKLQKLLLSVCGKVTPQYSKHWPSSWVTEGANFKSNIIRRALWAYGHMKG